MKKIICLATLALVTVISFAQKDLEDVLYAKDGLYAKINTNKGEILLFLEHEKAPLTVANFVALAEGNLKYRNVNISSPYYNGITFHRVIKDFMIQTGDPSGSGSGNPGYSFFDEFHESLKHTGPGILSMANAGPQTNGSQFFITHKETPWLDGKHSVFGHVVKGQEVVDAIVQGDSIRTIEIIRSGKSAKKFKASKTFNKIMTEKVEQAEKEAKERKKAFEDMVTKNYPTAKSTPTGLMYVIEKQGEGKQAEAGKKVKVHYTGTFEDGSKFDSSLDRGQPIEFELGVGMVIKGWDEGIALLKEGGKATLIIPPHLAYGSVERGPIPANSTLFFDVELIEVNDK